MSFISVTGSTDYAKQCHKGPCPALRIDYIIGIEQFAAAQQNSKNCHWPARKWRM